MIFQLRHRCPHCKSVADFAIAQASEAMRCELNANDPGDFRKKVPVHLDPKTTNTDTNDIREACGLTRCPLCGGAFMIVFRAPAKWLQVAVAKGSDRQDARLIQDKTVLVERTYPAIEQPVAHPTWPPKIQQPFIDLQHMLADQRHPSFIIGGCRSVLDVATKHLGATQDSLFDRIDELADKKIITGALKDWSDKLRKDGNVALHELNGTAEDAAQLVEFLKLFLHVAFELPATISAKAPTVSGSSSTP